MILTFTKEYTQIFSILVSYTPVKQTNRQTNKNCLLLPYIDSTVTDDSHTRKMFMNYFYDCCIQESYITLLYQVYLKTFYYSTPRENFFLWEILINRKCYFKINNEALQGKIILKKI